MATPEEAPQTPRLMTNSSVSTAQIVDLRGFRSRPPTPSPVALKQSKTKSILTDAKDRFKFRSSASRKNSERLGKKAVSKRISTSPEYLRSQRNVSNVINPSLQAIRTVGSSGPIPAAVLPVNKPLPSLPIARIKGESPQHRHSLIDATEKPLARYVSPSGDLTSPECDSLQPTRSVSRNTIKSVNSMKQVEKTARTSTVATTHGFVDDEDNPRECNPDDVVTTSKKIKPHHPRGSADALSLNSPVDHNKPSSLSTEFLSTAPISQRNASVNKRKSQRIDSENRYGAAAMASSANRVLSLEKSFSNLRLSDKLNSNKSAASSIPRPIKSLSPRRYSIATRPSSPLKYRESGRLASPKPVVSPDLKPQPYDSADKQKQASSNHPDSSLTAESSLLATADGSQTAGLAARRGGPSLLPIHTLYSGKTSLTEETMPAREPIDAAPPVKPYLIKKMSSLETPEAGSEAIAVNEGKQVVDPALSANTSLLPTPVITEGGSSTEVLFGMDLHQEKAVVGEEDVAIDAESICPDSEVQSSHMPEVSRSNRTNENTSINVSNFGPMLKIDEEANQMIMGDEPATGKDTAKKIKRRTSVPGDLFHRGSQFVKSTFRKSIIGLSGSKTRGSLGISVADDDKMSKMDKGKGKAATNSKKDEKMKPTRKHPERWTLGSGRDRVIDDDDGISPVKPRANAKTSKLPAINITSPAQLPVPTNTTVLAESPIHASMPAANSSSLRAPQHSTASRTSTAATSIHRSSADGKIPTLRRDLKTAQNIIKGIGNNFFESVFHKMGNPHTNIPRPATLIPGVRRRRDPAALAQRILELAREEANIAEQTRLLEMGEALVQGIESATTAQEAAEDARQVVARAERAALLALEAVERIIDELENLFPDL